MVSSTFEAQLASEGATSSAEARLAFQEKFALCENVAAKLKLVHETFVPGTPDFWFYTSLCTLLEVQTLMEMGRHETAWQMVKDNKMQLETAERELTGQSCWRRFQRIHRRRLLLELDLLYKLESPRIEIESVTKQLSTALQVNFQDPEPAELTTEDRKETLPTVLDEGLLDFGAIIENKMSLLKTSTARIVLLKQILSELDVFGREIIFHKILLWDSSQDEQWKMLEIFLDDYPLEYTDIPGYLDVIIKDVRRKKDTRSTKGPTFNYRVVHQRLSFAQLLECLRQAPDLFLSNGEFAVRGIELLRAAAENRRVPFFDPRREAQVEKELENLATYLEFLHEFSSSVNCIRVVILYRKLQLLNVICHTNATAVTKLLRSLVEYVKIAGGRTLSSFNYFSTSGFKPVYQTDHDIIIRQSLQTLWSSAIDAGAVFAALSIYLDASILDVEHALTMIKLGKGVLVEWTEKLKAHGQELSSEASSAQVIFCESNPTYFMPEDPLRVYVRTRNVKLLTAHLYEINTFEFYSRMRSEVKGDICLDGLLPTEKQVVDLSHLTQWQEFKVLIEFRATNKCQRGVFVVDVFEKGITCRAILRKGFLSHVEHITTQGHELTVLDERGNLLRDARALLLNAKTGGSRARPCREYTADEIGKIVIPFRHFDGVSASDKFLIAFCHGPFSYLHGSFDYLAESLDLNVNMYIDSEQLLPGFIAQVATRPNLLVAGRVTGEPLDLIVDVKIIIEFDLVNNYSVGLSSHKETLSFASMQQIVGKPPCFKIPTDAQGFNVTFEGRVIQSEKVGLKFGELPKVSDSKRFEVQRVNNFDVTYTAHLSRKVLEPGNPYNPSEFRVLLLGHNGEPIPNVPVGFVFKHIHSSELIKANLQSDASGEITLGQLQDIERLTVKFGLRTRSTKSCSWEMPNLQPYQTKIANYFIGDTVEIPVPFAFSSKVEAWIDAKLVSICENVGTVLQNAAHVSEVEVIKNNHACPISIGIRFAQEGSYVVYVRPLNFKYFVTVCVESHVQTSLPHEYIIQPAQLLSATQTPPLTICSQELKSKGAQKNVLEIQLRNASIHSTHVLVLLKRFLDMRAKKMGEILGMANSTSCSEAKQPKSHLKSLPLPNVFFKMSKVKDEYAYILQRRALASSSQNAGLLLGSPLLPKPSLLQNPHVISQSDMEVVIVGADDEAPGLNTTTLHSMQSREQAIKMKAKKKASHKSTLQEQIPSISFLSKRSQLLVSSIVSPDGIVQIDLSGFALSSSEMGCFEICTIAFDSDSGYVCSQELAMAFINQDEKLCLPKRDIRLSVEEALAPNEHFQQENNHECIHSGDVKMLPHSFSCKYGIYDSLESAIKLWPTLTTGLEATELASKVNAWWSLSFHEKKSFYFAHACDDFHFFLYRKDPDFFTNFAKPLLQAKIGKSLVDYHVLGDEASLRKFYLSPAAFQRLCCIEKLLVAERMSDKEVKTRICRAVIREIDSMYPLGCISLTRLFNTVLSFGQAEPSTTFMSVPQQVPRTACGVLPPHISSSLERGERISRINQAAMPLAFGTSKQASGRQSFAFSSTSSKSANQGGREAGKEMTTRTSCMDSDDDFGVRSLDSESDDEDNDDTANADGSSKEKAEQIFKVKEELPYIPPGKVRKVQEKRFFAGQYPALSGCNKFWRGYAEHILRTSSAQHEGERFISSYFPEALVSSTEGLFALAVLDIDIEAKTTKVQPIYSESPHVTVCSSNDAILYHRSIGSADCSPTANCDLIVKQRIQDEHGDFTTELLVNKIYTTVVTMSNISSEQLNDVNLLLQIPQGSLPIGPNGFYTKNEIKSVAPNHTAKFNFSYYFPEAGAFTQYPARASLDGFVIAWAEVQAEASSCKVVHRASFLNLASWTDVCTRGSLQDVTQFIKSTKPGQKIDYERLYWRCHDVTFFQGMLGYLRQEMVFVTGIWKYGLFHCDAQAMCEYFAASDDVIQSVGGGFCSLLLDVRRLYNTERFVSEVERFGHCEFGPFITRRVHPVTGRVDSQISLGEISKTSGKRILNFEARQYFGELCQRLGNYTQLNGQQLLVMAYFMVLFDRISDAVEILSRLECSEIEDTLKTTVQYAYLTAFLDFFRAYPEQEQTFAIARQAIALYGTHPQPRWRQRFQKIREILEEFETFEARKSCERHGLGMVASVLESNRSDRLIQTKLEARMGENTVELLSQHLGQCELAFYPIDVELMFSTEPFNTYSDSAAFGSSTMLVEPRQKITINLNVAIDANMAETIAPIPDELSKMQMIVRLREVSHSRTVKSVVPPIDIVLPHFGSKLKVGIMTQWGILQALHVGLPVRSCYVKVYAKVALTSGRTKTEFYKDGYTDLLGKFDYLSINGDLSKVEIFSILISHDKFGTSVERVDPPVLAASIEDFSNKDEHELLLY